MNTTVTSTQLTAKNKSELDTVVKKERRKLLSFIRKRVADVEDAEDILQDVFYQLANRYSLSEPIERVGAWLFTVAKRRIIDWYKKKKPTPESRRSNYLPENAITEQLQYMGESAEDEIDNSQFQEEFLNALEQLPDDQREAFVQHELEGVSFKEMSNKSGVPVNTLISRKRYAVKQLRKLLGFWYDQLTV